MARETWKRVVTVAVGCMGQKIKSSSVLANLLQNILVISEKKFRVKKVRKKCSPELFDGIGPKYSLNFTFCHFYENHPFYNLSQIFIAFRIKNKEVCKKKFENRPNGSKVMAR